MKMAIFVIIASVLFLSSSQSYKPPSTKPLSISDYIPVLPMSLYHYSAPSTMLYARTMEAWYGLPPYLLQSLMYWESGGKLHARNKNPNGTQDNGPMQYNNRYIKHYATLYNNGEAFDACSQYSIQVAAREIVSNHIRFAAWRDAMQEHNPGEKGYADRVIRIYLAFNGIR
jgi:hypothetical protein